MAENKVFCPNCEWTDVEKNYNYDTALIDYECKECGHTFTDDDLMFCDECGEQIPNNKVINSDGMMFCSVDCVNKFEINNGF